MSSILLFLIFKCISAEGAPGTSFTKQLTQILSFLRNFITSVVWLYVGQTFFFCGPFKTFSDGLQMLFPKFALKNLLSWSILVF